MTFKTFPKSVTVQEKGSVEIECEILGKPTSGKYITRAKFYETGDGSPCLIRQRAGSSFDRPARGTQSSIVPAFDCLSVTDRSVISWSDWSIRLTASRCRNSGSKMPAEHYPGWDVNLKPDRYHGGGEPHCSPVRLAGPEAVPHRVEEPTSAETWVWGGAVGLIARPARDWEPNGIRRPGSTIGYGRSPMLVVPKTTRGLRGRVPGRTLNS